MQNVVSEAFERTRGGTDSIRKSGNLWLGIPQPISIGSIRSFEQLLDLRIHSPPNFEPPSIGVLSGMSKCRDRIYGEMVSKLNVKLES